jgi:hypothetical protein
MRYTILHSPNFADYRGDHDSIIIPQKSVAAIDIPAVMQNAWVMQKLEYVHRQTQHAVVNDGEPWWKNEGVMMHVRSTSPGDIIADEEGKFWVVESDGFSVIEKEAYLNKCECCGRPFASPKEDSKGPSDEAVAAALEIVKGELESPQMAKLMKEFQAEAADE